MRIDGIIWLDAIVEKLASKHGVEPYEVEEALASARFRLAEAGVREGEDVYMALGRTAAGRYLAILLIRKLSGDALIISARDMAPKERRQYGRK